MSQPLGSWSLPYLPLLTTLGYLPCALTGLRLPGIAGVTAPISIMTAQWPTGQLPTVISLSMHP